LALIHGKHPVRIIGCKGYIKVSHPHTVATVTIPLKKILSNIIIYHKGLAFFPAFFDPKEGRREELKKCH